MLRELTASGMVIRVGEFSGGGIAPIIACPVTARSGIRYIPPPRPPLAVGGPSVGFFNGCLVEEAVPRLIRVRA